MIGAIGPHWRNGSVEVKGASQGGHVEGPCRTWLVLDSRPLAPPGSEIVQKQVDFPDRIAGQSGARRRKTLKPLPGTTISGALACPRPVATLTLGFDPDREAAGRPMKIANTPDGSTAESSVLSHAIANDLREGIMLGRYQLGTRVRQDELAERYGTSRIPVREALRDLESEGLVVLVPNRGAWIAKIDIEECVEIYKIREYMEPLALSESLKLMDAATVEQLDRLVQQIESAHELEEFLKFDREFHLLSYRHAKMPTLFSMIERFWNTTQHYRRAYSRVIGREGQWIIHHEHRLIMDAISRRDSVDAEQLLQVHIRRTRCQLQKNERMLQLVTASK
ncbi:GntR family transcriptional regulator [Xanthobacteraceae bacterium Astr-EGSB]|uniref:GntR family transcriptional regulator n=1 Tax=Astrobacterium formosum TaxID=3069710 RepID=UPI0027B690EE|nr:GntR family transcriptional regulator [Xanthobacteraceae bacterium Astr-EGSB]